VTAVDIRPPLARSRTPVIGGVCAGLAVHLGWSVRTTRALAVVFAIFGGGGLLMYAWLWALVPLTPINEPDAPPVRRAVPVAALLAGSAALVALVALELSLIGRADLEARALVVVTALSTAAAVWNLVLDRGDPKRHGNYAVVTRSVAAASLIVTGIVSMLGAPTPIVSSIALAMIVLGVGVLAAPRVVTLWTELLAERATTARQEQRAEIAAHLHDSVLQTLALIQNRAGASSEVARIARAQERELRDWLFADDSSLPVDLAAELRADAAAIELDHAARIDVVTAGDSVGYSSSALVAAAREAMLNAARHAGGDVSVYVETSPKAVDVFVRDRGPGVDLATLPADRLGIRESIIGRMTRAGGWATVGPSAGGTGTEIHLHLEEHRD
jgi:signal transduction histidine kinase